MLKENKAFTLAEVLVTLLILGVVAAITIPAIMAEKDKQTWSVQLKKAYATVENARRLTALDYGGDISSLFDPSDGTNGNVALQAFAQHLNLSKNCGTATGCWYDGMKNLDNTIFNIDSSNGMMDTYHAGWLGKAILADGTSIYVSSNATLCSTNNSNSYSPVAYAHSCGVLYVDLNGKKIPNMMGRDIFRFVITKDAIYPSGEDQSAVGVNTNCSSSAGSNQGFYCALKVIKEGAENY